MRYYIRTRSNELYHHGVKGMKWGVRRAQKKWEKNVNRNWYKAYNNATSKINKQVNDINAKYTTNSLRNPKTRRKYITEYVNTWNSIYESELVSTFGKPAIDDGRRWCERVGGFMDVEVEYSTWLAYR